MDDITVDIKTPKNMDATVMSVLLLFRHRFRHAMIKFDLMLLFFIGIIPKPQID
jgi:hypothetical protein